MTNEELINMTIKEIDSRIDNLLKILSDTVVEKLMNSPRAEAFTFIGNVLLILLKGLCENEYNNITPDDDVSPLEFSVLLCLTTLKLLDDKSLLDKVIKEFAEFQKDNPLISLSTEENLAMIYLSMLRTSLLLIKNEFSPQREEVGFLVEKYTHYENNEYVQLSRLKGSLYYLRMLIQIANEGIIPQTDTENTLH
jgi:hypothetical protein